MNKNYDEIPHGKQRSIIDSFTNFAASSGECTQRDSNADWK
jgi:hypothetical protein